MRNQGGAARPTRRGARRDARAGYPDDPTVPDVTYSFADALSELLPRFMPEVFSRKDKDGKLFFDVPGYDVTSYDYLIKLSNRKAPLTSKVDITNFASFAGHAVHDESLQRHGVRSRRYLIARGDTRVTSWAKWVENAKFKTSESEAGARNWIVFNEHTAPGKAERLARSQVARMALQRVLYENKIDAFVHPENTVPNRRFKARTSARSASTAITPFFPRFPRVVVPAGVTDCRHTNPCMHSTEDKTDYESCVAAGGAERAR
jgi:hypothetical protein